MFLSSSKTRSILFFLIPAAVVAHSVSIGDEVCVAGYIMDTFCISNGILMDNPTVSTLSSDGPSTHSVHCLVDMPPCMGSPYEVLTELEDGSYGRAWRAESNDLLLTHVKANGVCDTCDSGNSEENGDIVKGYQATVVGTVVALSDGEIPPVVKLTSVSDFEDFESVCGVDVDESMGEESMAEETDPGSDASATSIWSSLFIVMSMFVYFV